MELVEENGQKKMSGKNFALTIVIGIFIAIMVITLFNLLVTYVYEDPQYGDYCEGNEGIRGPYPVKYGGDIVSSANCSFSTALQDETDSCLSEKGIPVYDYDDMGCTSSLKECNMCNQEFRDATKSYNRQTFFIYAAIGFALIVAGLFVGVLLIQIITLPAGAFLVIEAAVKNFDDKLYVIITFSLLIISAVYKLFQ